MTKTVFSWVLVLIVVTVLVIVSNPNLVISPIINHIFYSFVLLVTVFLITKNITASITSTIVFSLANLSKSPNLLASDLIIPGFLISNPKINAFHAVTAITISSILLSLFLKNKRVFYSYFLWFFLILVSLTLILLLSFSGEVIKIVFDLGLACLGFVLFKYSKKVNQELSLLFLYSAIILFVNIIFNVNYAGLLGLSIFSGALLSLVFSRK